MGRRGAILGLGAVLKFKPCWKLLAGSLGERFQCWNFVEMERFLCRSCHNNGHYRRQQSNIIITITAAARKIEGQEVGACAQSQGRSWVIFPSHV